MDSEQNFKGDESLQDRFDRAMTGDTSRLPGDADEKEDAAEEQKKKEEIKLTRREKRQLERIQKSKKEEEELRNINEYWYKDPNISVKVPKPDVEYDILITSLLDNRVTLETLKRDFCRSKRRQHKTITEQYMHEIKRHVLAIEAIKDVLAARGEDYRVYYTDREHPLEACRRIVFDCFVATTLYGPEAYETDVLRLFRDVRLKPSCAGRLFIKIYYAYAGPMMSRLLLRFPGLDCWIRPLADRIVRRIERIL